MNEFAQSDKISAILQICKTMNAERDLPALLNRISLEAKRLVEADRLSVFLLDRDQNELWSVVTQDSKAIRFDARLGIAGEALTTGQTINVPDAYQDSRFFKGVDLDTGFRTSNLVAVPLRNPSGAIVGVCEALNKDGGLFTEEDEHVLETFADHATASIEMTQLLTELKESRDQLQRENLNLKNKLHGQSATQSIIGMSRQVQAIIRLIDKMRETSVDVLILGESGTGKELVAKALHYNSPRANAAFVAVNSAALPDNLVESELFGIEKGVATGVGQRIGKFEQADGGTLFLDEIGDLSLAAQAKILRVLQERVLERVGGRRPIHVDVRVIAATNQDLEKAIKQGKFRADLYFRLNVMQIRTPPLREIPEDIPLLARYIMTRCCEAARQEGKEFSPRALRLLQGYKWPGNVRELGNEVQRLVISVSRNSITEDDLPETIRGRSPQTGASARPSNRSLHAAVEQLEERLIREALEDCQGSQRKAATLLGLSRQGLLNKMRRYGLT